MITRLLCLKLEHIPIAYQWISKTLLRDRELQAATEGNKASRTTGMIIHVCPGTLSVSRVVGDKKNNEFCKRTKIRPRVR